MTSVTDLWTGALGRMQDEHRVVRLTRRIPGADVHDGYVVRLGRRWLLLAHVPEIRVDGYVALRLRDLERVQVSTCDETSRRLLQSTGAWPPAGPAASIALDRTRDLVATAAAHGGLVHVEVERVDPDVAFFGAPAHGGEGSMVLDEVTPQGVRDGTVSRWRYREITKVAFSGSYETDLLTAAGPPPTR
ncbi:hypothetical protein [Cellulomonas sp. SLBN-39]|uniref:hypothetical protein n=1 Tax=Cellulomonas sp. SLBN-39 TaxID=2768446 RepID=UPI001154A564|nr:hypothetical protein [Cellulomonas sp. SLBN-39]TQL02667.1 hypothetical protein FBY24_1747 [Cellulomonas sp. SLBN-39]